MKSSSLPHTDIDVNYEVVIIGSGYGGGIAASRLARAGRQVCVLERGKEYLPGEFPKTLLEATEAMQFNTTDGRRGSATGLYDFHVNRDISVLRGCGLGGTSLINANVVIKADRRVFTAPHWPKALIADLDKGIKKGYELAQQMLSSSPYPTGLQGFPALQKNVTHELASKAMPDANYFLPNIAVNFKKYDQDINHVGVEQKPCVNCGDCCTGCNYTAKNTVQMTYLPDAVNHGAKIFTEMNVKYISKTAEGKWAVHYEVSNTGTDKFTTRKAFVLADMVVVSGGTLGSTEILLRSKKHGLQLSDAVGTRFSGNGDTFALAYNTNYKVNGIGWGSVKRDESVGPCITAMIDTREKSADYKEGMTLQEGAIPGALGSLLPVAFSALSATGGNNTDSGHLIQRTAREWDSLVRGPYHGAVNHTKAFLVMTHDDAKGTMKLDDKDQLQIEWPSVGTQAIFDKVDKRLTRLTTALQGTYIPNPMRSNPVLTQFGGRSLVTVHPLGGCPMGEDAKSGAVNHKGQVFSDQSGDAVHEGLYVTDGSIIPTSLGTNPLLTISALSENNIAKLVEEKGWTLDYSLVPMTPRAVAARKPGLQFTESMHGHISLAHPTDYASAEADGIKTKSPFRFIVTIESDDLDKMLTSPEHQAKFSGIVEAKALSDEAITVTNGIFNLFVDDQTAVNNRKMLYQMTLTTEEGKVFFIKGFKDIKNNNGLDAWNETTTLYVDIYADGDISKPSVGKGILYIAPFDLLKQLSTMKVTNVDSEVKRLEYMAKFGRFFAGSLYDTYGQMFKGYSYFDPKSPPRIKRTLRIDAAPRVYDFVTEDNVPIRLTRYQGGTNGPVLLSHGLGVSSKIFSIDTIDTNLLEYLTVNNYDVWLLDYRASIELAGSKQQFTADDIAKYDYPAAVKKIKELTGVEDVQVVAHCFGATTFTMSVLGGYLSGIRSAVLSQVSAHIVPPLVTQIKSGLHVPGFLDLLNIKSLDAFARNTDNWLARLADQAAKFLQTDPKEQCDNPVCYRINAMYGQLYQHEQLNSATHVNVHEMFGEANIKSFEHLALMCRTGYVVDAKGNNVYMPNFSRMTMPTTFISGDKNKCFLPESTQKTYDALRAANKNVAYSRYLIPGYGHIDCIFGKNAARDVYPVIKKHLDFSAINTPRRSYHTLPPKVVTNYNKKPIPTFRKPSCSGVATVGVGMFSRSKASTALPIAMLKTILRR